MNRTWPWYKNVNRLHNIFFFSSGGNDGASCLNTMERYDPVADSWTCLAPMNTRRSTHDVAVIDGTLYAVGGNDGSSSLNSIEKYDPETNKWTSVVSMSTRRSSVGVVVAQVLLLWGESNKADSTVEHCFSVCVYNIIVLLLNCQARLEKYSVPALMDFQQWTKIMCMKWK